MLRSLAIQDLALIEEGRMDFTPGFIAITGETGAGKSIFLAALRLVTGGRAQGQIVRSGKARAVVEAIFDLSQHPEALQWLAAQQIAVEPDGETILHREILAEGKSRARINGTLVSQTDLADFGRLLLQFHGQSEQVLLRDVRTHLQLVDAYSTTGEQLQAYRHAWERWQLAAGELDSLKERATQLAEQKEFLQFQADELGKAKLQPDEESTHEQWLEGISERQSRRKYLDQCLALSDGDSGLLDMLGKFSARLSQWSERAPEAQDLAQRADALFSEGEDLVQSLRKLGRHSEPVDERELERINGRLALIQRLRRKYRTDFGGLLQLRDRRMQELETLENLDLLLQEALRKSETAKAEALGIGSVLGKMRRDSAQRLDTLVRERLAELGMAGALFTTVFTSEDPGPSGLEKAEFHIAPNAGEGLKPLRQSVSGGELSRVLLAFKSVLAERDQVPVLVFDEVDSGISGQVAHHIARCLHDLGQYHQVLTITHLHQVACRAHAQISVSKSAEDGRTRTTIQSLDAKQRVHELARMLGDPHSPTVIAHAQKILEDRNGLD